MGRRLLFFFVATVLATTVAVSVCDKGQQWASCGLGATSACEKELGWDKGLAAGADSACEKGLVVGALFDHREKGLPHF